MRLADEIRTFICEEYISHARNEGKKEISIRAGDIHQAMGLSNRMPAVCSALKSKNLREIGQIEIKQIKAPPKGAGANFVATFEILYGESKETTKQTLLDTVISMKSKRSRVLTSLVDPIWNLLQSSIRKANEVAERKGEVRKLIQEVLEKMIVNDRALRSILNDLETIVRLISAWANRKYNIIPMRTIILIIAGLLYFLNPIDIIPDVLPFIGYTDDVAVIAFIIKSIGDDLDNFRGWENGDGI